MRYGKLSAAVVLAYLIDASHSVFAFPLKYSELGVDGALDTTVAFGTSMRLDDRSSSPALNTEGNRNFDKYDIYSSALKVTQDLQLNRNDTKLFLRGSAFYDFALANESLDDDAHDRAVTHVSLLDAYIAHTLYFNNDRQLNLRAGKQVISWGESTFISNSLNSINTFDLGKLRIPGAELKDALLPTNMLYANMLVSEGLTVEGFYLLDFVRVYLDPVGTFFSTNDSIPDGGHTLSLGGASLTKGRPDKPSANGQWGVAIRNYFPVGNGVEVGVYFYNTHSPNPTLATRAHPLEYYLLYPEHVRTYGTSFNTRVGPFSWSGEYSFRDNAPIQRRLFANVLRTPITSETFPSVGRIQLHQAQTTLQQIFGRVNSIKADSVSAIAEIGATWTPDFDKYLDAPLSSSAWGYVFSLNATYNRLVGNVNVTPTIQFSQNVQGTLGPFSDDRKALTTGFTWSYSSAWTGSLLATLQYGGVRHNSLDDRDNVAAEVKWYF